jgi:hypothetical protein
MDNSACRAFVMLSWMFSCASGNLNLVRQLWPRPHVRMLLRTATFGNRAKLATDIRGSSSGSLRFRRLVSALWVWATDSVLVTQGIHLLWRLGVLGATLAVTVLKGWPRRLWGPRIKHRQLNPTAFNDVPGLWTTSNPEGKVKKQLSENDRYKAGFGECAPAGLSFPAFGRAELRQSG